MISMAPIQNIKPIGRLLPTSILNGYLETYLFAPSTNSDHNVVEYNLISLRVQANAKSLNIYLE